MSESIDTTNVQIYTQGASQLTPTPDLKHQLLVAKLIEGEQSGDAGILDIESIKLKARQKVAFNIILKRHIA